MFKIYEYPSKLAREWGRNKRDVGQNTYKIHFLGFTWFKKNPYKINDAEIHQKWWNFPSINNFFFRKIKKILDNVFFVYIDAMELFKQ